jgi:hypothetical protein
METQAPNNFVTYPVGVPDSFVSTVLLSSPRPCDTSNVASSNKLWYENDGGPQMPLLPAPAGFFLVLYVTYQNAVCLPQSGSP